MMSGHRAWRGRFIKVEDAGVGAHVLRELVPVPAGQVADEFAVSTPAQESSTPATTGSLPAAGTSRPHAG